MPDILREHFKRNSEADIVADGDAVRSTVDGEVQLSRKHRDVQDDQMEMVDEEFEKLMA